MYTGLTVVLSMEPGFEKYVFEVRENVMAQRWNLRAVAGLCEFPLKLVLEVGEITYPKG